MRLMSSPWGRVIRSIREDEDVANSLGKNVYAYKLQSLVLGGVLAGLAGVMLALGANTVNANSFAPQVTFFLYAALILGGAATRIGPIVGAMLFWFILAGGQTALAEAGEQRPACPASSPTRRLRARWPTQSSASDSSC